MRKFVLVVSLVMVSLLASAQVFTDGLKTYLVGQANAVSGGTVTDFEFSPKGKYLLFQKADFDSALSTKEEPTPIPQWYVHQVGTNRTVPVNLGANFSQADVQFLGDERFLVVLSGRETALYNIETGTTQPIPGTPETIFYLGDRPSAPFLIREIDDLTIGIIRPGQKELAVKMKNRIGIQAPYFADNRVFKFAGYQRNSSPIVLYDATLDLTTGSIQVKPVERGVWDTLVEAPKEPRFRLRSEAGIVSIGSLVPPTDYRGILKLTTKVCPSDFRPRISPDDRFVAYVDAGALLVRRIKEIDTKQAEEMLRAAERAEMLSIAKQVGTALIIYASDMNDVLPNADQFNDIYPYLKNRDMMKAFTYTFGGGPAGAITDPAKTELGYVQGATGRAMVYADGHARWIPNP